MPPHATPTAVDALHVLLAQLPSQPRSTATGSCTPWPASHRVLAIAASTLLCLLAGLGCADTRPRAVPQAVVPTYSYVHDATPEVRLELWSQAPLNSKNLIAGRIAPP